MPLKFHVGDSSDEQISWQDFFHIEKFHHYCHGIYSTQYCSFKQKSSKSEWLAWHDEEHHSLFNTLVDATAYEIEDDFSSWNIPSNDEDEPFNISINYPLLIVQGDLYECSQKGGKPSFTRRNHIQFRKSVVSGRAQKTFHIDVIVESYLKSYLGILEIEHGKIIARFKRKKKDIRRAIDSIVAQAKDAKAKKKLRNFREILEF